MTNRHRVVLPAPDLLARNANRQRQRGHPQHPKDLGFTSREDVIPDDFLLVDIDVNDRRHFIFSTNRQVRLLKAAKNWFVDGTFKVVKEPFKQLFSVHAYVTSDGNNLKQVPLVFIIMSGRKSCDYRGVYTWLDENISDLRVQSITSEL